MVTQGGSRWQFYTNERNIFTLRALYSSDSPYQQPLTDSMNIGFRNFMLSAPPFLSVLPLGNNQTLLGHTTGTRGYQQSGFRGWFYTQQDQRNSDKWFSGCEKEIWVQGETGHDVIQYSQEQIHWKLLNGQSTWGSMNSLSWKLMKNVFLCAGVWVYI